MAIFEQITTDLETEDRHSVEVAISTTCIETLVNLTRHKHDMVRFTAVYNQLPQENNLIIWHYLTSTWVSDCSLCLTLKYYKKL